MIIKIRKLLTISILIISLIGCGSDTKKEQTNNTEQQRNNTEQQTNNADQQTNNADQQTNNADQQTNNADQQTNNTEQQTNNAEQQTNNADQQTNNTEQQTNNAEQQRNEIILNYPFVRYTLGEFPSKIILSSDDKTLYILNGVFGVSTIDIQDVNNPLLTNRGRIFPGGNREVYDIVSSPDNNTLYLGVSDGIYIYDTSDPTKIVLMAKLQNSFVKKLVISKDGKTLYASGKNFNESEEVLSLSGLIILDVTNLNAISQLGFYTLMDIKDIKLSKDEKLIYLASGELDGGMEIIDISNATQPSKLSSLFNNRTEYVSKIVLSEDETKAYVINNTLEEIQGVELGEQYLTVVDIESPNAPKILNSSKSYTSEYINFGIDLSLNEENIYIGAGSQGFTLTSVLNDKVIKVGRQELGAAIIDFVLSKDKTLAYIVTDNSNLIIMNLE